VQTGITLRKSSGFENRFIFVSVVLKQKVSFGLIHAKYCSGGPIKSDNPAPKPMKKRLDPGWRASDVNDRDFEV
jgi:hypothetical protein